MRANTSSGTVVSTGARSSGMFIAPPALPSRSRRSSTVIEAHGLAHVTHGFLRHLARTLAAVGDDAAHQRRVVEVGLGALVQFFLLPEDGLQQRLLALEATDAGAATAFLHPVERALIRIDRMQLPHRAALGLARVGAAHARGVGLHGAD